MYIPIDKKAKGILIFASPPSISIFFHAATCVFKPVPKVIDSLTENSELFVSKHIINFANYCNTFSYDFSTSLWLSPDSCSISVLKGNKYTFIFGRLTAISSTRDNYWDFFCRPFR